MHVLVTWIGYLLINIINYLWPDTLYPVLAFLSPKKRCFPGGGGTDLERGYGDVRPWRPPFHTSPVYTIFALYRSGRLGAFTAKSGRKHYNPPPLTVMWMNFDSPNFPSLCSLSAIISFQTCSNKCILYVLSFHKCIKIKYKTVNKYGVFRD